jgi:hypothetical protein
MAELAIFYRTLSAKTSREMADGVMRISARG